MLKSGSSSLEMCYVILARHAMPSRSLLEMCDAGLRFQVKLISCWDSISTDAGSPVHLVYELTNHDGLCPPGYAVRLPTLFYETIWEPFAFKDIGGRFVFAKWRLDRPWLPR